MRTQKDQTLLVCHSKNGFENTISGCSGSRVFSSAIPIYEFKSEIRWFEKKGTENAISIGLRSARGLHTGSAGKHRSGMQRFCRKMRFLAAGVSVYFRRTEACGLRMEFDQKSRDGDKIRLKVPEPALFDRKEPNEIQKRRDHDSIHEVAMRSL